MRIIKNKTMIDVFYDANYMLCVSNSRSSKIRYVHCYKKDTKQAILTIVVNDLSDVIDEIIKGDAIE